MFYPLYIVCISVCLAASLANKGVHYNYKERGMYILYIYIVGDVSFRRAGLMLSDSTDFFYTSNYFVLYNKKIWPKCKFLAYKLLLAVNGHAFQASGVHENVRRPLMADCYVCTLHFASSTLTRSFSRCNHTITMTTKLFFNVTIAL